MENCTCMLLPPANEVWGKVIFLHVCVILSMGGVVMHGYRGGMHGCRVGGHAWLWGGVHGWWGAHAWLWGGGHAWLWGGMHGCGVVVCVVVGGMRGCQGDV